MQNIQLYTKYLNPVVKKIQEDLSKGIKELGDYSSRQDIIRIWSKNGQKEFLTVAGSAKRFGSEVNTIEIQSFSENKNFRLSFCFYDIEDPDGLVQINQINVVEITNNFVEKPVIIQEEILPFIKSYLDSIPDTELTKKEFFKEFRKDGTYVLPE